LHEQLVCRLHVQTFCGLHVQTWLHVQLTWHGQDGLGVGAAFGGFGNGFVVERILTAWHVQIL
jgi:hypothetical protein